MDFQYFVVAIIVFIVIIFQFRAYLSNEDRINRIKRLFPDNTDNNTFVFEDGAANIVNDKAQDEFKGTLDDINSYLEKNKNKTYDYHILEGIVERNSASLENEVDTMLSVPLYWGLIATIFGIAFGVVVFAWKDLANLLAGAEMNPQGIRILLTDVGIAMTASLAGVFFTKQSTAHFNSARTIMVKNKNRFLTWIQTNILSKDNDDFTGAILRMTNDLNEFNRTFATNTEELRETLSSVNSNYSEQIKLLDRIENLNIGQIARANIDVYNSLQGCTNELERLFEIISNSNDYLNKVVELNANIGSVEERTRLFEEMGNYFHNEIEYVRDRQGQMRQQMSGLDSVLQDALNNMGESLRQSLVDLTSVFQQQNQNIQVLIEEQSDAMANSLIRQQQHVNEKIGQINEPFSNVSDIFKEGVTGIKNAFEEQNTTINEMLMVQKQTLEHTLETQMQTLEHTLETQKQSLEDSLKQQQETALEILKDTPEELKSLTGISSILEKLNKNIEGLKSSMSSPREIKIDPIMTEATPKEVKMPALMKWGMPIGLFGTFLALVALIVILLFDIKL